MSEKHDDGSECGGFDNAGEDLTTLPDGGSAFPTMGAYERVGTVASQESSSPGMSLRDWFAGHALAGLLAAGDPWNEAIEDAYAAADDALAYRRSTRRGKTE